MSERPTPFAPDHWFHCYNRGVDKRQIFMEEDDCERFMGLLYLCNGTRRIRSDEFARRGKASTVLAFERGKPIVDLVAYCLMPNHFHLIVREIDYGGISAFMQRLGTAYSMFFNKKYARTGSLFSGKFKANLVDSDAYFRRLFNYIHANPAELYEPQWKEGIVNDLEMLEKQLASYRYSSFPDYIKKNRSEVALINMNASLQQLHEIPSFRSILEDARAFYNYEKGTGEDLY